MVILMNLTLNQKTQVKRLILLINYETYNINYQSYNTER